MKEATEKKRIRDFFFRFVFILINIILRLNSELKFFFQKHYITVKSKRERSEFLYYCYFRQKSDFFSWNSEDKKRIKILNLISELFGESPKVTI